MGFLINELKSGDITPNLTKCVAEWRNKNLKYFFDQKPVSEESSRNFLENKVRDSDSIFAGAFNNGDAVGHIGIIKGPSGSEPELDNLIVGGRAEGHYVADELEKWAIAYSRDIIRAKSVGLKLLSHNFLAKRLHLENGFAKIEELKLHETQAGENRNFSVCRSTGCELHHSIEKAEYWQLIFR